MSDEKQIIVGESALPSLAMTAIRYAAAALATSLASKGWLEGDQTSLITGVLTAVATAAWALYRTWRTHKKLVRTADAAPNSVAKVK